MRINLFRKYKKYIMPILVIIFALSSNHFKKDFFQVYSQIDDECTPYQLRLEALEPEKPENIPDPPFHENLLPSKVVPISEVIEKGKEIPLEFGYNDPNWERQAYKSYWHSTVAGGRWSYVPNRVHFAMHRLFTTYPTSASVYYDFVHQLGIEEESNSFKVNDKPQFYYIKAVVMQSDVEKLVTYGNQVVLISRPKRTGLQVLCIPVNKIKPFNSDENLLIQLTTLTGDEIDYSVIPIIKAE